MKKSNVIIISIFLLIFILSMLTIFYIKSNKIENKIIYGEENIENDKLENNKKDDVIIEKTISLKKQIPSSYTAAIPIFMYHWIRYDTGDYMYPENMVKPSTLEEQIKYLVENNFEFIYITDLKYVYEYTKPVALTFDDGWTDVYTDAFPLAKKYNIKISMYIIKDNVGKNGYCTEEQLKEMQKSGLVDIQSHTVTHPYLADLSYQKQKIELFESKKYLKDVYNIDSQVICYPYGSRNENTVELANEAGYTYGLDMDGGVYYTDVHTNLLKIPRIYANRSMNIDTFANFANKSKVDVVWEE